MAARFLATLLATCTLVGAPCLKAADGPRVLGERAGASQSGAAPRLRLAIDANAGAAAARIELPEPDTADVARLRAENEATRAKRLAIGVVRDIAPDMRMSGVGLAWSPVDGGAAV